MSAPRRGAVLIIVVGLSVALLGLSMTFLVRMRADANESQVLIRQAQARAMLVAACTYVQEASRIGWGEEAYGWRDIRDGGQPNAVPGPRGRDGRRLPMDAAGNWLVDPSAPPLQRWPAIGGAARCPMRVPVLPPYATRGVFAYNPVARRWPHRDPNLSGGEVRYNALSPQPAQFPQSEPTGVWSYDSAFPTDGDDGVSDGHSGHDGVLRAFAQGSRVDPDDPSSLRLRPGGAEAWFRVYREDEDTFVVTVGDGASAGFRDWSEVVATGASDRFLNDRLVFREAFSADRRHWYRIQWSPSVAGRAVQYPQQRLVDAENVGSDSYRRGPAPGWELWPPNYVAQGSRNGTLGSHYSNHGPSYDVNHMGTISFIERLVQEPVAW